MLINLSELFTCEGKRKVYEADFDFPAVEYDGGHYKMLDRTPFELTATNTGTRKYLIEGSTDVTVEIPCARCLEPVAYSCHLDLTRELEIPEEGKQDVLDEQPYLEGYNLDVNRLVYNELLLSLPMKVLCREDCKGICNRCGTNLNHGDCSCDTSSLDPRMSVIQDIYKNFKEV